MLLQWCLPRIQRKQQLPPQVTNFASSIFDNFGGSNSDKFIRTVAAKFIRIATAKFIRTVAAKFIKSPILPILANQPTGDNFIKSPNLIILANQPTGDNFIKSPILPILSNQPTEPILATHPNHYSNLPNLPSQFSTNLSDLQSIPTDPSHTGGSTIYNNDHIPQYCSLCDQSTKRSLDSILQEVHGGRSCHYGASST